MDGVREASSICPFLQLMQPGLKFHDVGIFLSHNLFAFGQCSFEAVYHTRSHSAESVNVSVVGGFLDFGSKALGEVIAFDGDITVSATCGGVFCFFILQCTLKSADVITFPAMGDLLFQTSDCRRQASAGRVVIFAMSTSYVGGVGTRCVVAINWFLLRC